MKKTWKKSLSIFLTLSMVAALTPTMAWADGDEPAQAEGTVLVQEDENTGDNSGNLTTDETETPVGDQQQEPVVDNDEGTPADDADADNGEKETPADDADAGDADVDGEDALPPVVEEEPAPMLMAMRAAEATDVAKIVGGDSYPTLAAAVEAATSGAEIQLLESVEGSGVKIDTSVKSLTIDLNKKTYTIVNPTVGSQGTETNAFQLLKGGSVTFKNGTLKPGTDAAKILLQNYCDLTLEDVTVDCRDSSVQYAASNNNGSLTVTGESNIYAAEGQCAFDVWYNLGGNYPEGVIVTFDKNFTGEVKGRIEYGSDQPSE